MTNLNYIVLNKRNTNTIITERNSKYKLKNIKKSSNKHIKKNFFRGYITRNESQAPSTGGTVNLRPKLLGQQKTVLKAPVEPSGSVQKFKALAEKWEQRSDVVTSPPPPPLQSAPLLPKKEQPRPAPVPLITSLFSSTSSATVTKG